MKIRSAVAQFHVRWPMTHCASLIDRIWLVAPASLRRNFTAVGEFSLIVVKSLESCNAIAAGAHRFMGFRQFRRKALMRSNSNDTLNGTNA